MILLKDVVHLSNFVLVASYESYNDLKANGTDSKTIDTATPVYFRPVPKKE